jgi:MoxR-like ATPase
MSDWRIYRGTTGSGNAIDRLPPPPPWRRFDGGPVVSFDRDEGRIQDEHHLARAASYLADEHTIEAVNTALYLRLPLLVTGAPGSGKSTLAYAVARELGLGRVLRWPVSSRSTLKEGLYRYDAISRIEDANILQGLAGNTPTTADTASAATDIGRYLRLGPLGTALAPYQVPRVVLIDGIDRSDNDLPNDLLNIFEEGAFEIPELFRLADSTPFVEVRTADGDTKVYISDGHVRCNAFPFVVLTSTGERDFPPAFLRRCVRLELPQPDSRLLTAIVEAHLGAEAVRESEDLIETFLARRTFGELAADQLLNAIYFRLNAQGMTPQLTHERLAELVLRELNTED